MSLPDPVSPSSALHSLSVPVAFIPSSSLERERWVGGWAAGACQRGARRLVERATRSTLFASCSSIKLQRDHAFSAGSTAPRHAVWLLDACSIFPVPSSVLWSRVQTVGVPVVQRVRPGQIHTAPVTRWGGGYLAASSSGRGASPRTLHLKLCPSRPRAEARRPSAVSCHASCHAKSHTTGCHMHPLHPFTDSPPSRAQRRPRARRVTREHALG